MQVSQTQDHINHAIIGGGASIDFGISSSAEFFHLLSSTLYRDQILAVVREVMCNAWDAHIEAGRQDRPIEITIDNDIFMVTDHGLGIHHDDMGPIYGVYGNSTKKNDGTQTGGFGLGCKSPFAYTDHFEVTSCHEGVKTIYRLSKSVVQNGSKPGIIRIASFPTEESGLTVKITLKSPSDRRRFHELAQRIAFNGEMLAEINKEPAAKLGFDSTVRNFHIYRNLQLLDGDSKILVRYGNVVYPVESCKELQVSMNGILDFLGQLNPYLLNKANQYKILFQAPPHSLSVTPSREALSMQEHTIKTLQGLFEEFLSEVKKSFTTECDSFSQATIEKAIDEKAYHLLFGRREHLPIVTREEYPAVLKDFKAMAQQYLTITYPSDLAFRKADWKCRVMLMSQKNLINRGLAQTWLRDVDLVTKIEESYWAPSTNDYPWLARRVIAPLLGKLTLAEGMNPDKLYVVDDADRGARRMNANCIPAVQVHPQHHFKTAAYLRNIVVLSRRKKDIYERAIQHEMFTKFGKTAGFLFYHVGMKANDAAVTRAFFAKTGMNVVDMIERQEWEESETPVSQQVVNSLRKPRNKGLVKVSYLALSNGIADIKRWRHTDAERIEKPECVIRVYTGDREDPTRLDNLDSSLTREFIRLFGDRAAVSTNTAQYAAYTGKKGALNLREFLAKEVVKHFTANMASLQKYWACHHERVLNNPKFMATLNYQQQRMLKAIYQMPKLADHFQVSCPLQDIDRSYLRFYEHLTYRCATVNPEFDALKKEMDKIPLDPAHKVLMDKLSNSKLLSMLDTELDSMYRTLAKSNPAKLDKFVEIIKIVVDN